MPMIVITIIITLNLT